MARYGEVSSKESNLIVNISCILCVNLMSLLFYMKLTPTQIGDIISATLQKTKENVAKEYCILKVRVFVYRKTQCKELTSATSLHLTITNYPCIFSKSRPNLHTNLTLSELRGCLDIISLVVSGWAGGWMAGRWDKVFLGHISETVRCRELILGREIGWGCRFATSWSGFDLTFDLAVVTLTYKILSGLYL